MCLTPCLLSYPGVSLQFDRLLLLFNILYWHAFVFQVLHK